MVKIPSSEEIKRKYVASIGRVPAEYKKGIQGVTDWQEKAVAGQGLYEQMMADAAVLARRAKAIANVSNEEWKKAAADKGAARIGPGMTAAADKQARKFAPFRETLAGLELPAKTADSMANIDNRLKKVVKALEDTKKSIVG